ncbi:hypothetical protein ACFY4B_26510 [Kitasatospora sp. NPDC001261]|uniref:hypothetical protein n=1 Tax=Kitasatospora sp. NPDC001261 TaxID=3364012 RepID=UPI00367E0349
MTASALAPMSGHAPVAALLGQLVLERGPWSGTTAGHQAAVPGWWVYYTCRCCLQEQFEPLPDLPAEADEQRLTSRVSALFWQPCALRPIEDGYAVHPAGVCP